jgi:hypothetical protein
MRSIFCDKNRVTYYAHKLHDMTSTFTSYTWQSDTSSPFIACHNCPINIRGRSSNLTLWQAKNKKSIQIATKDYDGGSYEEALGFSGGVGGHPDAFSLYSNQQVRMDRLLFRRRTSDVTPSNTDSDRVMDTSATKTTAVPSLVQPRRRRPPRRVTDPPRRVTRLSFEVHPSLLVLNDLILLANVSEVMTSSQTATNVILDECESTAK